MSKKVYIVQDQKHKNENGELVSKFNFEKAKAYGELVFIADEKIKPFDVDSILPVIKNSLKNITYEDFFLPIGNPTIIGLCLTVVLLNTNGKITSLQWSGKYNDYFPIEIDMHSLFFKKRLDF